MHLISYIWNIWNVPSLFLLFFLQLIISWFGSLHKLSRIDIMKNFNFFFMCCFHPTRSPCKKWISWRRWFTFLLVSCATDNACAWFDSYIFLLGGIVTFFSPSLVILCPGSRDGWTTSVGMKSFIWWASLSVKLVYALQSLLLSELTINSPIVLASLSLVLESSCLGWRIELFSKVSLRSWMEDTWEQDTVFCLINSN